MRRSGGNSLLPGGSFKQGNNVCVALRTSDVQGCLDALAFEVLVHTALDKGTCTVGVAVNGGKHQRCSTSRAEGIAIKAAAQKPLQDWQPVMDDSPVQRSVPAMGNSSQLVAMMSWPALLTICWQSLMSSLSTAAHSRNTSSRVTRKRQSQSPAAFLCLNRDQKAE
eukprot:m.581678 g.581678  ORF g.581678 m.581678 type:complete len:166 (-) comp57937_c2_seq20:194-691(-)